MFKKKICGAAFCVALSALAMFAQEKTTRAHRALKASAARRSGSVPETFVPLGEFVPTFYRILDESAPEWTSAGEAPTEELRTRTGRLIARVAPAFRHQLDIEGSGRLRDGRIVNFDTKRNGGWRYVVARDAPFGLGALDCNLIPYRTLAVDPKVVRLGTVLFIPALVGVRLPSGEIHDGYFFAHDTGQDDTVQGKRIDVFVGFESDVDNTLTRSGRIINRKPVEVYRVDAPTARRVNERFRKQFERR